MYGWMPESSAVVMMGEFVEMVAEGDREDEGEGDCAVFHDYIVE